MIRKHKGGYSAPKTKKTTLKPGKARGNKTWGTRVRTRAKFASKGREHISPHKAPFGATEVEVVCRK